MNSLKHAVSALILSTLLLTACQPALQSQQPTAELQALETSESEPIATPQETVEENAMGWWNEIVFYEIFVRSFKDHS